MFEDNVFLVGMFEVTTCMKYAMHMHIGTLSLSHAGRLGRVEKIFVLILTRQQLCFES